MNEMPSGGEHFRLNHNKQMMKQIALLKSSAPEFDVKQSLRATRESYR